LVVALAQTVKPIAQQPRISSLSTAVRATSTPTDTRTGAARAGLRAGFVPALDGLRGVAVLLVILYHFAPDVMPAGFLGVDVFFVLSGFLITRLLLVEARGTGGIRLKRFWGRRARRLLPAMFLAVGGTCVVALLTDLDGSFTGLARHARASLLYVVNWAFIAEKSSYFASFETPSPLRHMWSLAIEEQFYLVWPLMLVAVFRLSRRPLRTVGMIAVAGAVASAALMAALFQPGHDPSRVYYGTDTRIFGVLIGGAAAVALLGGLVRGTVARVLPIAGALAIAGVLLAAWRLDDHTDGLYRGGLFVLSLAVAVVVVAVTVAPASGAAPVLSLPLLRQVGVISYGLYLFHWPVFIYVSERTTGRTGLSLFVLRGAVTAGVAVLSYVFVERPIRERRWRLPVRSQIALAVGVGAALLVLTTWLPVGGGLPAPAAEAVAPTTTTVTRSPDPASTVAPTGAAPSATAPTASNPTPGPTPLRILAAGDSVGFTFAYYWPLADTPGVTIDGVASLGCRLQPGQVLEGGHVADADNGCPDWRHTWPAKLDEFRPDVVVLFATEWEAFDSRVDDRDVPFGSAESDAAVHRYLDDLRAMTHAAGARLVLVASPPITAPDQPKGNPRHRGEEWRVEHLNGLYRSFAAAHPDQVAILALDQLLCAQTPCPYEVDGTPVFYDGLHFSADGLKAAAPPILAQLRAIAAGS
jgi:peptidoglycan/LPS O-acetylase OafA/YrhL